MANEIHNERVKLVANALDRASTGALATGIFVPTAAYMFGQSPVGWDYLLAGIIFWGVLGIIFHVEARRVIATVRES
jgi:hypothetical protein